MTSMHTTEDQRLLGLDGPKCKTNVIRKKRRLQKEPFRFASTLTVNANLSGRTSVDGFTMRLILCLGPLAALAQAQNITSDSDLDLDLDPMFDDCALGTYYGGLGNDVSMWDRDVIHNLIFSTHRNQVRLTNNINPGVDDVWGALMDVDEGVEPNTVRLIFSDDEIPNEPFGERGWIRDQMFPISRGVGTSGIDLADLHNLRPTTRLSNIVAGDRYFGECGVLTDPDSCVAPAEGSGPDTCVCNRIFEPPASKKGDIARALMYMDLRYDGTEPQTRDLRLTDCPFQPERDMAYLSQMLTWHREDPPDEAELMRNEKVCANWQGNRNPFVDYPELADFLFPPPSPLPEVGERFIYEKCESIPTNPPTSVPNECDMYEEGDFVVWLMNSEEPLSIGFYSFAPMEVGFELLVTDYPWNGEEFVEEPDVADGTMKFTAPTGFGRGGRLFGFGLPGTQSSFADRFETVSGNLSINVTTGEPLFLYCISASGAPRPLTIFNNGGLLTTTGLDSYAENESALPEGFPEEGIINLPHFVNLLFSGIGEASGMSTADFKTAIRDPANWEGSNESRYTLDDPTSSAHTCYQAGSSTVTTLMVLCSVAVAAWLAECL